MFQTMFKHKEIHKFTQAKVSFGGPTQDIRGREVAYETTFSVKQHLTSSSLLFINLTAAPLQAVAAVRLINRSEDKSTF